VASIDEAEDGDQAASAATSPTESTAAGPGAASTDRAAEYLVPDWVAGEARELRAAVLRHAVAKLTFVRSGDSLMAHVRRPRRVLGVAAPENGGAPR